MWLRRPSLLGEGATVVVRTSRQKFGEVDGGPAAIVALLNLGSATETVGEDHVARLRVAHRRQQHPFRARHRHVVVAVLEAEVACQSTATRIEDVHRGAGSSQHVAIGRVAKNGVVMTMRLDDNVPVDVGCFPARGVVTKKLGERDGSLAKSSDVVIVREQFRGVASEHGGATGFEADHESTLPGVAGERGYGAM